MPLLPKDITTNPRLAGLVRRYHTWPVIREQTVAEHSWQVLRIYDALFGLQNSSIDLVFHALYHDCGEIVTGDLPYPVKSSNPIVKQELDALEHAALNGLGLPTITLVGPEYLRFKVAHMLEMWEYGLEECMKGNKFAHPIMARCRDAARNLARGVPGIQYEIELYMTKMNPTGE